MTALRYPPELWERARQLYVQTNKTAGEVAKECGIAVETLRKRSAPRNEDWPRLRRQWISGQVQHEQDHATLAQALNASSKIESRTLTKSVGRLLMEQVRARIEEANAQGIILPPHDLASLSATAYKAQEIEFKALGINPASISIAPEKPHTIEVPVPEHPERGDRPVQLDDIGGDDD